MRCEICQRPAENWCAECWAYYCEDHGGARCFRCSGEVAAVEVESEAKLQTAVYTTQKVSLQTGKGYLQCESKPAMPTIYIDDDGPPECFECGALAKKLCSHCLQVFCPEHHGRGDTCVNCIKSSRIGFAVMGGVGFALSLVLLLAWMFQ